jgi:hypothetical protein
MIDSGEHAVPGPYCYNLTIIMEFRMLLLKLSLYFIKKKEKKCSGGALGKNHYQIHFFESGSILWIKWR